MVLDNRNSPVSDIQRDSTLQILRLAIQELKQKYNISSEKLLQIAEAEAILIPVTIFENPLSPLEVVCKYLKENKGLTYHKIAVLLNRNDRTIWATYNKAAKKQKSALVVKETSHVIPSSVLKNRKLSILESVVKHLKESGLSYKHVSELLKRDQRNIWTVYNRAEKKR